MAGRHAYPLGVLEARNRKHLTRTEKDQRRKSEVQIPSGSIKCPRYVKTNADAYRKWKETLPILRDADLLKPSDVGALARYCIAWSEYLDLLRLREEVSNIEPFTPAESAIAMEELNAELDRRAAAKMWQKIEFIFSAQAVLAFDKAINQKMSAILALEDRLFLNILARTKNVINQPEEAPVNPLAERGFGCV